MSTQDVLSDWFYKTKFAHGFAIWDAANAAKSLLTAGHNFMEGAGRGDPNLFEKTGYELGEGLGSAANAAISVGGLAYLGAREGGRSFNFIKPGLQYQPNKFRRALWPNKGGLMKSMNPWVFGGFMLAQVAAPIVGSLTLGFAGKILDQANMNLKYKNSIKYDQRYFNTSKYDESTYQNIGAAMDGYSRAVSMARIFHHRG